jgi:2',3'-cyclic-nucleotide 2'-phosphodiesterase (5'-nucleotidase family)
MIGDTAIVQAWEHGKALGVLTLHLRTKGSRKAEGGLRDQTKGGISNIAVNTIVENTGKKLMLSR